MLRGHCTKWSKFPVVERRHWIQGAGGRHIVSQIIGSSCQDRSIFDHLVPSRPVQELSTSSGVGSGRGERNEGILMAAEESEFCFCCKMVGFNVDSCHPDVLTELSCYSSRVGGLEEWWCY
eukprot:110356-Ditylum_brightwellii.AAC.1